MIILNHSQICINQIHGPIIGYDLIIFCVYYACIINLKESFYINNQYFKLVFLFLRWPSQNCRASLLHEKKYYNFLHFVFC